jgi:tryptophan 2,3-dioxygenase
MPELRSVELLSSWWPNPDPDTFPYGQVHDDYLRTGKHFVSKELLDALHEVRSRLGEAPGAMAQLRTFCDVALDKFDERYDYVSYLALSLLPLPTPATSAESGAQASHDRLFAQLLADMMRFELQVLDGETDLLPQLRPDKQTAVKRLRLAARAAGPALGRLGLAAGGADAERGRPAAEVMKDSIHAARQVVAICGQAMTGPERLVMRLSMLPVWTAHDEYMFIRVLQAFETTFALLAVRLGAAVTALAAGEPRIAGDAIDGAGRSLNEASRVFSVMATMQVGSFLRFRDYTEGASAIQSRNYKTVESLCASPERSRLNSPAYLSVPEVRTRLMDGSANIDDALWSAVRARTITASQRDELTAGMRRFEATLLQWRQTHYRLAVRMLGDRSGTGYTEGTPYLKGVRTIPVFRSLDRDSARDSDRDRAVDTP